MTNTSLHALTDDQMNLFAPHAGFTRIQLSTWCAVLLLHASAALWIYLTPSTIANQPTQTHTTELEIIPVSLMASPTPAQIKKPTEPTKTPRKQSQTPSKTKAATPQKPQKSTPISTPNTIIHTPPSIQTATTTPVIAPTHQTKIEKTEPLSKQEAIPSNSASEKKSTETAATNEDSGKRITHNDKPLTVTNADYLQRPADNYPAVSREQGDEGTPIVEAIINEQGFPEEIHIFKSSGHRLLDKAAIDFVKKSQFKPQKENGKAVSVKRHIPIKYMLDKDD